MINLHVGDKVKVLYNVDGRNGAVCTIIKVVSFGEYLDYVVLFEDGETDIFGGHWLELVEEQITDATRLFWLATKAGVDGVVGVDKDRYEYACECASERTGNASEEPNRDDELNGFRRMIDAGIKMENL